MRIPRLTDLRRIAVAKVAMGPARFCRGARCRASKQGVCPKQRRVLQQATVAQHTHTTCGPTRFHCAWGGARGAPIPLTLLPRARTARTPALCQHEASRARTDVAASARPATLCLDDIVQSTAWTGSPVQTPLLRRWDSRSTFSRCQYEDGRWSSEPAVLASLGDEPVPLHRSQIWRLTPVAISGGHPWFGGQFRISNLRRRKVPQRKRGVRVAGACTW